MSRAPSGLGVYLLLIFQLLLLYQHPVREQEIGEFAHAAGGGKQHVDEVFHQAHHGAGNGAHGEGSDQGGQFRKIQLDEAGHQWHAEAEKHEDG